MATPKPKVFVLELTEQEWKDNQQMGAFAGMKISYTMEGDKYKIELTTEQYEKYKKNCGESRPAILPNFQEVISYPIGFHQFNSRYKS